MSPPSDRPAGRSTLRMVADRAGVSTATVSYVLSGRNGGRTGVSAATVRRVRSAADQLDYRPNQAARAIRTGRSQLVLLSLTMMADPWSQAVADAVSATVSPAGLTALILADGDWPETLARQSADAAFLDAVSVEQRSALHRLAGRGQRLVVFDDHLEPAGFDVIRSSAVAGCRLAVRHLLDDHVRIGCLTSTVESPRAQIYREEMRSAGIQPLVPETFGRSSASADAAATRLLTRRPAPTAIYATTDFAAISTLHAAHRLGLRVPDDVAVIGVGNASEAERTQPRLTSVGPTDLFPRVGTLLRDRATGADIGPPGLHEFSWSLVIRDSTRPSAATHLEES